MYVSLKTSCFVDLFARGTQRTSSKPMASWGSSESNTHRYYINTSIHTQFSPVALIYYSNSTHARHIHTYRHWRLLEPKNQISCLNQKVCSNLSFCKCFGSLWRAYSKLDFSNFQKPVGRGVCMSETSKRV